MQQQKKKDNTSGKIRINSDKFFWDYQDKNILEIDIKEILVIGEYTNSGGPWFDDWFLTFITKDGQWQSISMYADNINELLDILCRRLDFDLRQNFLTGSTEWSSVILYPISLKGKQLFKLTPTKTFNKPKTFFGKLLSSMGFDGFNTTKYISLTDEVKNELAKF